MAKAGKIRTRFVCNSCGSVHPKWMGKCPDCGEWDSLEETREAAMAVDDRKLRVAAPRVDGDLASGATPVRLRDVDTSRSPRRPSGIGEFDRVLGGGLVPGMAVLVGGEPGIGKSTLLLQAAGRWAGSGKTKRRRDEEAERRSGSGADTSSLRDSVSSSLTAGPVLYVTSEESAQQTKLRADRLGIETDDLLILAETNLERILHQIHQTKASVVVVDSIQMVYKPDLPAAPGSVTQLRDACMDLVYLSKQTGVPVVIVGHVTKAGTLAGPKIIEHIVDTVVYFEGDRFHAHRIVRCVKNRFGGTHEVGLFEMGSRGLAEVTDPGRLFAEEYGGGKPPSGSVLTVTMQGSRSLLVEVQALTASSVIGAAKRKVSGFSADRTAMIIAVLEKRGDLRLAADDVFVNVAGGVKVAEPATDLAVAMAIASAHFDRPLPPGTLCLGELGLGGEVRPVPQIENRLKEAARLGVGHAVIPHLRGHRVALGGVALHEVRSLNQAMGDL
jgi:DNA repair protein RadA/Sms